MANGAILGQTVNTYSKEQIMASTVPPLYGLGSDAVPSDVLKVLSRFHSGLGNEYLWAKEKSEWKYKQETVTDVVIASTQNTNTKTVMYADSITIESENIVLVNPSTYTFTGSQNDGNTILLGKYVSTAFTPNVIIFIPSDAVFSYLQSTYTQMSISKGIEYSNPYTEMVTYGYVNSSDPSAYPTSVSDGYTYTPLGQLGNKAQIATGSYTGTGKYGQSNPNSLTFEFEPKLVLVLAYNGPSYTGFILPQLSVGTMIRNAQYDGSISESSGGALSSVSKNGNTVFWYNTNSAELQLNISGTTYHYIIFG